MLVHGRRLELRGFVAALLLGGALLAGNSPASAEPGAGAALDGEAGGTEAGGGPSIEGPLLFLGLHPVGEPAVPYDQLGALEQAVLDGLRRIPKIEVVAAIGAGPGDSLGSRDLARLREADRQLEEGLAAYLALDLETAATQLAAASSTFQAHLAELADPRRPAQAGLYLALTYQAAGQDEQAHEALAELVRLGLDKEVTEAEIPPALAELLVEARTRRAREAVVGLTLESHPEGAAVFLDGALRGRTPWKAERLMPGQHGLRLELPGYLPVRRTLELSSGERTQRLTLSLLQGRALGGAGTLLELRQRGAGPDEQETEILHQAEAVGAAATVVGFVRGQGAEARLLLGLYRSERAAVLGLLALPGRVPGAGLPEVTRWVGDGLQHAPSPPTTAELARFYDDQPGRRGSGRGRRAPGAGPEVGAGEEDGEELELEEGSRTASPWHRKLGVVVGGGTGWGWVERASGGGQMLANPTLVDLQLQWAFSGPLALGLAGRAQLPGAAFLIEPRVIYGVRRGTLLLQLHGGLPVGEVDLPRSTADGGPTRGRWAGPAFGAAGYLDLKPWLAVGLQLRALTLFPTSTVQLDLLGGLLIGLFP